MSLRDLKDILGLKGQFILLVSTVIIGSALSVGFYLTGKVESVYRDELTTRGRQLVENLAYNAEFATLINEKDELKKLVEGISRDSLVKYVRIYDNGSRALHEYGDVSLARLAENARFVPMDPADSLTTSIWRSSGSSGDALHFSAPIVMWESELDREQLGSLSTGRSATDKGHWTRLGRAVVGFDLEPINIAIGQARTTSIIIMLVVTLMAISVTFWFMRLITKPIESLAEITNEISRGQLDTRLDLNRTDEIGRLAASFDRMVESLRRSKLEVEKYHATLEEKIRERSRELEEAQNQVLQSEKMSAVGQLAAGVAHELNNPLAGILGYAQFALEKLQNRTTDSLTPENVVSFTRYLTDIEAQARRCKGIVQNLLRFSRSSETHNDVTFNINDALKETVELLRHQLEMKQIRIIARYDESAPEILGNSGQIQQVFTNLIINAMHATDPGGEIRVSTNHSPTLGEFDGAVEVVVKDNGSGIPSEIIGRIFEPFFTTKEVGKGTGLGLSVSYGIICDHGGEIRVESEVGLGTRFELILPVQRKESAADTTSG